MTYIVTKFLGSVDVLEILDGVLDTVCTVGDFLHDEFQRLDVRRHSFHFFLDWNHVFIAVEDFRHFGVGDYLWPLILMPVVLLQIFQRAFTTIVLALDEFAAIVASGFRNQFFFEELVVLDVLVQQLWCATLFNVEFCLVDLAIFFPLFQNGVHVVSAFFRLCH